MNIRNRIKIKAVMILMCLSAVLLAGCGSASEEKMEEVQTAYAALVGRHNEVIEAYAEIDDDSFSSQLNEMADKINAIGQQDIKGLKDEEIDAIIADLEENITVYDEILASIKQMSEKETAMIGIPVTIKNNTGIKFYEIYLYHTEQKDKGENLAGDLEYLDGYGTLNIINLYMAKDQMIWRLEVTEKEEKKLDLGEVDFTGCDENGVTISIEFSFDTMEGWVEVTKNESITK